MRNEKQSISLLIPNSSLNLAEGVGFEPTVDLHPQRFSRPPRSTTPAPLQKELEIRNEK